MQRIFTKKLLLLFSAVAFISYGIIWACAGGDWDEFTYSSYAPEAFVDSAYKPFFFSEQFYYKIGHDEEHVSRFNQTIVDEWRGYLGAAYPKKEIQFLLLEASPKMIDSINTVPIYFLPASVHSLKLVQAKAKPNVAAFFKFLGYAKVNESYAATRFDYWDYDDSKPRTLSLNKVQKEVLLNMESEFQKTKDNFIKQRYFFQILRAHFLTGNYKNCIDFYGKHKTLFPYNILAARCLSYVAGCYYKQKNYAQSNYLYSKIYDVSDDFKTVAHFSFHPQNESDWKQTLALCTNKEEQITLWQLIGIYFDEQRAIKEIYALDPKSEKLDLLLSRLVNLQERKVNADYGNGNELKGHLDSLNIPATTLVAKIAEESKTAKPFWWNLSAGYLYYLNADFKRAEQFFSKAERVLPKEKLATAQHRLLVFMNRLASASKLNEKTEEMLLPDLFWLQHFDGSSVPNFRHDYAYSWAKLTMAKKYAAQKEILKSELFQHQDSFYATSSSVNTMKAFLQKQNKTPFEAYCASIYPFSVVDINEFQAVVLSYQDKIDEAIQLIEQTDKARKFELYGNPFNGNIKDCHDCEHAAPQKVKYTKLSFLQKLKELKANVAAGNDVYSNALLLGNAFYNMSYYGNARCYYEGPIIYSAFMGDYTRDDFFSLIFTDCSLAKSYYQLALKSAINQEQKAKASYLILKCERNQYYNGAEFEYDGPYAAYIPKINYGVMKQFEYTKYYAEVIKECGYFRSYLKKNK